MTKPTYQFRPSETGLCAEIYLPKRAEYQGALYDAITDGFQKDKVESHFRNADEAKKEAIKNMLEDYFPTIGHYTDAMIDRLMEFFVSDVPIFSGYSMYEVDGVFYSSEDGIIEDRSQVIRIIFRPPFGQFHLDCEHMGAGQLDEQSLPHLASFYFNVQAPHRLALIEKHEGFSDIQKTFFKFLDEWMQSVALFLIGFLMFNISIRLLHLRSEDETKGEEEIWITSSFLRIHRIPYLESQFKPTSLF